MRHIILSHLDNWLGCIVQFEIYIFTKSLMFSDNDIYHNASVIIMKYEKCSSMLKDFEYLDT